MIRGIERRRIFRNTDDYEAFAARLDRLIPELGFRCFAWVLMPNHVHLALQTRDVPLSRLMARLGTGYALYFNYQHDRVGHVFQNRYKSRLVVDDIDLEGLVVYIHANPVKACLVGDADTLGSFPWCGHGACVGDRAPRPFESIQATLRLFGTDDAEARRNLMQRLRAAPPDEDIAPLSPGKASRATTVEPARDKPDVDLEELIEDVCRTHSIPCSAIGRGYRSGKCVAARTELVRRAIRELGLPSCTVARALGVSDSTISRALARTGTLFP